MLVLTRKAGSGTQSILTIGAEIEVTVIEVSGDRVRLGISAPPGVAVDRKEIWLEKKQQAEAKEA